MNVDEIQRRHRPRCRSATTAGLDHLKGLTTLRAILLDDTQTMVDGRASFQTFPPIAGRCTKSAVSENESADQLRRTQEPDGLCGSVRFLFERLTKSHCNPDL